MHMHGVSTEASLHKCTYWNQRSGEVFEAVQFNAGAAQIVETVALHNAHTSTCTIHRAAALNSVNHQHTQTCTTDVL